MNTRPTIVFLDYDGVLHPDEVYCYRKIGIVLKADGISLFEYAPILVDILEQFPNTRIVLSTTWVRMLGFNDAKAWLPEKLQEKVYGATFHSHMDKHWWSTLTRYDQILAYVNRHRVSNWVAIDNDDEGWTGNFNHFVHTDDWLGIFPNDKRTELIEKLNQQTL